MWHSRRDGVFRGSYFAFDLEPRYSRHSQPEQRDEVALHLREMPGIRDIRVLGAPSISRGEQLVAVVVPEGPPPTLLQVRQFCAARLPPHKIPRMLVLTDEIPLDARGKTDRPRLDALVAMHLPT